MRVRFIGTSAGTPTSSQGTSGIFVNTGRKKILFDCGEGSQKRMMEYGASINIDAIFLTHLDSDHVLGIPGLIRTLELNNRSRELNVYASKSIVDKIKILIAGVHGWPDFEVNVKGFESGETIKEYRDFEVRSFKTIHDSSSHGFVIDENMRSGRFMIEKVKEEYGLEPGPKYGELKNGEDVETSDGTIVRSNDVIGEKRPGRTIVYTGDTRKSENTIKNSKDADLLIHESTFSQVDSDKASETNHSTAREAAEVAKEADVRKLVLTHISPRYGGNRLKLENEAKNHFKRDVRVAEDGLSVQVNYPPADND